jgi:hypothetical protein
LEFFTFFDDAVPEYQLLSTLYVSTFKEKKGARSSVEELHSVN